MALSQRPARSAADLRPRLLHVWPEGAPPPRPFPVMSGYGGDGEAASLPCERGREHIGLIISYIVSALKRLRDTCVFYGKRETV